MEGEEISLKASDNVEDGSGGGGGGGGGGGLLVGFLAETDCGEVGGGKGDEIF